MKQITAEEFNALTLQAKVRPRLRRELRFRAPADWDRELLAVGTRGGDTGVLLIELDSQFYLAPYKVNRRITDMRTGQTRPVTCDFCCTWLPGEQAARITFEQSETHSVALLCCGDLQCSLHVRDKTRIAKMSRVQLRESLGTEGRIRRLHDNLHRLTHQLGLGPQ